MAFSKLQPFPDLQEHSSSDEDDNEEEELLLLMCLCDDKPTRSRRRRFWLHDIVKERPQHGEYHTLFKLLVRDDDKFYEYFRMYKHVFDELLSMIEEDITMTASPFRRPIGAEERLAICLRFLSTGDSYKTIGFSYRVGTSTVRKICMQVCDAIWKNVSPIYMPHPTEAIHESNARDFMQYWQYPNCIGALDGKHVVIQAPPSSGSTFFNYKKSFSVVLMALVDARYRFVAVDIGSYGKNSDGGIYSNSKLGKLLDRGEFGVPKDKQLPGGEIDMPHVIVADEAFPLKSYIMRPYPQPRRKQKDKDIQPTKAELENEERRKVFNYRLSRARRIVENAFGILAQRWRIYRRTINLHPDNAKKVVEATCCLHNYLMSSVEVTEVPAILETLRTQNAHNERTPSSSQTDESGLQPLARFGVHPSAQAVAIRDAFKDYFMSRHGSLPNQLKVVRRGPLP